MADIYEDDSLREGEDNVDVTRQHPLEQLRLALVQGFCSPMGVMSVPDSFIALDNDLCADDASQSNLVMVTAKSGVPRLIRVARGLELFLSALFLLGLTLYLLGDSINLSEKTDDVLLFQSHEKVNSKKMIAFPVIRDYYLHIGRPNRTTDRSFERAASNSL